MDIYPLTIAEMSAITSFWVFDERHVLIDFRIGPVLLHMLSISATRSVAFPCKSDSLV